MENNRIELDERQMELVFRGIALSSLVAYVYVFISIVRKLLKVNIILVLPKIYFLITIILLPIPYYLKMKRDAAEKTGLEGEGFFKFDEHKKEMLVEALVGTAVIIVVITLIIIAFKLRKRMNIKFVYHEIGLLTVMSASVLLYAFFNKEYLVPKTSKGIELSLGEEKKSKQMRIISYLKNSFKLSIVFLILELYFAYPIIIPSPLFGSGVLPYILNFILSFCLLFLLNYILSEYNVKKKRKLLDDLE